MLRRTLDILFLFWVLPVLILLALWSATQYVYQEEL